MKLLFQCRVEHRIRSLEHSVAVDVGAEKMGNTESGHRSDECRWCQVCLLQPSGMCHASFPHINGDHKSFASEFPKPLLHNVGRLDSNAPDDDTCRPGDEKIGNVLSSPHTTADMSLNSRYSENRLDCLPVDDFSRFRSFKVNDMKKVESAVEKRARNIC